MVNGVPFTASTTPATGLVEIHRLYKSSSNDLVWLRPGHELDRAVATYGYVDQGVNFHALPTATGCGVAVVPFIKGAKHQYAVSQAAQDALTADGWSREAVIFWAPPGQAPTTPPTNPTDTVFSLAVMLDTQMETTTPGDNRFRRRTEWLAANEDALNLRYVLHSGGVTNWGWVAPSQYEVADASFDVLDAAGLPYQAATGNHDTRAVGYNGDPANPAPGGSAYQDSPGCPRVLGADQCRSTLLVRQTDEWNGTFPVSRFKNVTTTFEPGKSDNMAQTFSAGGVDWMVVTLELYPRREAVSWAKDLVAANPHRNVIVVTHSYLTAGLTIGQGAEYGATSPQYLYDNLIKIYPNIKMVFSGHVGQWGTRLDTGVNGNTIVSYLTCLHSADNPVRTLEIDTVSGQVTTKLVTPNRGTTETDATPVTLSFVR